jgi:hypothetical protein
MLGAVMTAAEGSWAAAGLALVIAAAGLIAFRRSRGTTLAAPAVWTVVSSLSLAAVEGFLLLRGDDIDPLTASLCRYAAGVSTTVPLMAVLGAKRPQDRGWQWIVLSLWIVLLVPAAQAVASRSAQLDLFTAWRWLLGALIAMTVLNYLPTGHAASAMLLAIGQSMILWPYLSGSHGSQALRFMGLGAIVAAALLSLYVQRPNRMIVAKSPLGRQNERWRAFRDGWGAFWGLRVLQRVNQTAELSGWPGRLEWWNGLVLDHEGAGDGDGKLYEQTDEPIEQAFDSLLRRFERVEARVDASTDSRG